MTPLSALFLLSFWLSNFNVSTGQEPRTWATTPGSFEVLHNTTARFNWTHTIKGQVDILWHYKGTVENPVNRYIMSYSGGQTNIPKLGDRYDRLDYTEGSGSAVMTLDHVTSADNGIYEVKVVDVADNVTGGFYISDIATLTVYSESDLQYTIRVDEMTLYLSVDKNGTNVMLPGSESVLQAGTLVRILVSVEVVGAAPIQKIQMKSVINSVDQEELPCENQHQCERKITFFAEEYAVIHITVDFGVQNLQLIDIRMPVTVEGPTIPSKRPAVITPETNTTGVYPPVTDKSKGKPSKGMITGLILTIVIVCLVLIILVIVFLLRKKKKVPTATLR